MSGHSEIAVQQDFYSQILGHNNNQRHKNVVTKFKR
jgi:hypothetical protein